MAPHFGTRQDVIDLAETLHGLGMKLVLDGVFNHASRGFFQFNHLLENGAASPYVDWFHVRGFPLRAYEGKPLNYDAWWGIPALPGPPPGRYPAGVDAAR